MKKAFKINLSGQIFHIDEDAYEKLKAYLDTISRHFSNVQENKEILSDIEYRIAELFREKSGEPDQVIDIALVEEIIGILGRPEEIANEGEESDQRKSRDHKANRRLYRDSENAILGGVSAGLGAYFNLDILLVRILFVVLTIVGSGLPILLYIVLWIAVPKAVTAAEKLEMKGEKITVSNIEKAVKEEYEEVKENLKKARNSESYRKTEDAITSFFRVIGTLVIVFFKVILAFIAIVLILSGIGLLFGTFSFLFFGINVIPFGHDLALPHTFPEMIQPFVNPDNASALIIAVLTLILIPILAIVYGLLKAVLRFKAKDKILGMGAFTIWFLALIAALMLIYYEGRNYQTSDGVVENTIMSVIPGDTLFLEMDPVEIDNLRYSEDFKFDKNWYYSEEMKCFYGEVQLNVRNSGNNDYKIKIEKSARGRDKEIAKDLAGKISYDFKQKSSTLIFNPYFSLEKTDLWRVQQVVVTVYIPEGKMVSFNENTDEFLGWIQNSEDLSNWEIAGKTMIMTENGLKMP